MRRQKKQNMPNFYVYMNLTFKYIPKNQLSKEQKAHKHR